MTFQEVGVKLAHRMCWVVVLGAALGSGAASAQPTSKPAASPSTKADAARPRYEKGRTYEAAGKLELAYAEYAAAYKLYDHWQIAGTLGGLALKLGKYREAAERITLFLNKAEGLTLTERNDKLKELALAMSHIGTLAFETAGGSEIFVDGKYAGRTPAVADVFVEPGDHEIEAKKAGESVKVTVEVGAGKRQVVKLRYGGAGAVPEPGEVPQDAGTVAAAGTGTGNGGAVGTATSSAPVAPEGGSSSLRSGVLGTGIALAVIGVLGGVSMGVASLDVSSKRDQERRNADRDAYDRLEDQRFALSNTASWSFVAAGVGVATILGAVTFWPSETKSSAQIRLRSTGLGGEVSVVW